MAIIDWLNYLSTINLLPPRPHVIEAHQYLGENSHNKIAVDCGCGTGRDTLYLLEKGYQVYAFDKSLKNQGSKVMNRWIIVIGAIMIQVALGAIYAWSAFTTPLKGVPATSTSSAIISEYAFSSTETQAIPQ